MTEQENETKYVIVSPDNIPILETDAASEEAAWKLFRGWVRRYSKQGYYSTASGERIPCVDLRDRCRCEPWDGV